MMQLRSLRALVFVGFLVALNVSASAQDAQTLKRVQNLKTPSLKNKITVYYSDGFKKRAEDVLALIEGGMRFYEKELSLDVDLSVAVLDKAQWEQITQIPYGLPWVSDAPHVAFLPAAGGIVAAGTLRSKPLATPSILEKLKASGFTFDQAAEKTVDLIGLHELGHAYSQQIGVVPPRPNKWFNEFLASYFAYAYLKAKRPKLAALFETMTVDMAGATPNPKYTKLEDFERLYAEVGPDNYGWFQAKFFERVVRVHDVRGLSFIADVRRAFPAGEKDELSIDVVLERSEKIAPGFITWSNSVR